MLTSQASRKPLCCYALEFLFLLLTERVSFERQSVCSKVKQSYQSLLIELLMFPAVLLVPVSSLVAKNNKANAVSFVHIKVR